jgi:drug/metabolite transporter (DMT)-like permease
MSLAFLRFGISFLLILPFLLAARKTLTPIKLAHLPKIVITSLLITVFNIALFYEGLNRTSAINASVLTLSVPIISLLAGWWFLKEKIFWINLVGIFFSLLGSIAIIGLPLIFTGNLNGISLFGNVLITISNISFVAGALLLKKMLKDYSATQITAIMFLIAAIAFFLPALFDYWQNPHWVDKISILGILGFLYITVLSSVSAFFLMNWGLKTVDLNKANLFQYAEPAIAATLAVPLLGERISFSFIIGTCLIVLGVYWGTLGKAAHHHLHHKAHRI